MFEQLLNLKFKRTAPQAFGFYISYFVLILLLGAIAGGVSGLFFGGGFKEGVRVGQFIAIMFSLGLALSIVILKKCFSFGSVLLVLTSVLLAILGGGLLGLIPVSYLTTKTPIEPKFGS